MALQRGRRASQRLMARMLHAHRGDDDDPEPNRAYRVAPPPNDRSPNLSIHVALNHVTHYRYDRRVALAPQVVRLRPAPHCRTRDPGLLDAHRTERAFHQLAAGPVCQLPGTAGVPGADHRVQGHGRSGGRDGGLQPVRLLPRARRRELPVSLRRPNSSANWPPTWPGPRRRRALPRCCTASTAASNARSTSWSASTSACSSRSAT